MRKLVVLGFVLVFGILLAQDTLHTRGGKVIVIPEKKPKKKCVDKEQLNRIQANQDTIKMLSFQIRAKLKKKDTIK